MERTDHATSSEEGSRTQQAADAQQEQPAHAEALKAWLQAALAAALEELEQVNLSSDRFFVRHRTRRLNQEIAAFRVLLEPYPTPTLTAERLEDGNLIVKLRGGTHGLASAAVTFTHAQLSEAVTRLQAVLTNAEAADLEDEQFAGES